MLLSCIGRSLSNSFAGYGLATRGRNRGQLVEKPPVVKAMADDEINNDSIKRLQSVAEQIACMHGWAAAHFLRII
jgi:hypothetical protein